MDLDRLQKELAGIIDGELRVTDACEPLLQSFDLEGVARFILDAQEQEKARGPNIDDDDKNNNNNDDDSDTDNGDDKRIDKKQRNLNIVVMCGAGISVAAGIPDFRSPKTGLYHQLQSYNLPAPESIFDIGYFRSNPEPFYHLAKEMWPSKYTPTSVHWFIRLLQEKGLLLRCYTQNIDTLERCTGVHPEKLVEAHGSFAGTHCIDCNHAFPVQFVKDAVFSDRIPKCTVCGGLVKPDIIFFGEQLPSRFAELATQDLSKADLLIVIGTSLKVYPFASLVDMVGPNTVRFLINNETVGETRNNLLSLLYGHTGFSFSSTRNYRDAKCIGDCQEIVHKFAELLGWKEELDVLVHECKFIDILQQELAKVTLEDKEPSDQEEQPAPLGEDDEDSDTFQVIQQAIEEEYERLTSGTRDIWNERAADDEDFEAVATLPNVRKNLTPQQLENVQKTLEALGDSLEDYYI